MEILRQNAMFCKGAWLPVEPPKVSETWIGLHQKESKLYQVRSAHLPEVGDVGMASLMASLYESSDKDYFSHPFSQKRDVAVKNAVYSHKQLVEPDLGIEQFWACSKSPIGDKVAVFMPPSSELISTWLQFGKEYLVSLFHDRQQHVQTSFLQNLVKYGVINAEQFESLLADDNTAEEKVTYLEQAIINNANGHRMTCRKILTALDSVTITEHLVCRAEIDRQMNCARQAFSLFQQSAQALGLPDSCLQQTPVAQSGLQWLVHASAQLEELFCQYSPVMDLFIAELFKAGLLSIADMKMLSSTEISPHKKLRFFMTLPVVRNADFAVNFMIAMQRLKISCRGLKGKENEQVRSVIKTLNEVNMQPAAIPSENPTDLWAEPESSRAHWLLNSSSRLNACCRNPVIFKHLTHSMAKSGLLTTSEYNELVKCQTSHPLHLARKFELILISKKEHNVELTFLQTLKGIAKSRQLSLQSKTEVNLLLKQLNKDISLVSIDRNVTEVRWSKIDNPIMLNLMLMDGNLQRLCNDAQLLDEFLSECVNLKLLNNADYETIGLPYQQPKGCFQPSMNLQKLIVGLSSKPDSESWKLVSALRKVAVRKQPLNDHYSYLTTLIQFLGQQPCFSVPPNVFEGKEVAENGCQLLSQSKKYLEAIFSNDKLAVRFVNALKKEKLLMQTQIDYFLNAKTPAYRKAQKLIWVFGGYDPSLLQSVYRAVCLTSDKSPAHVKGLMKAFLAEMMNSAGLELQKVFLPVLIEWGNNTSSS